MVFYCNWCGKPWHIEQKCFQKRDFLKKFFDIWKSQRKFELPVIDLGGKSWADICDSD